MKNIFTPKFILFFAILVSFVYKVEAQVFQSLGFTCFNNNYNLKLTTTKKSISNCKDTVHLSTSYTGNITVFWTDGYTGKSRVVSAAGRYQAYAYDDSSLSGCVDTTDAIDISLNDAYLNIYTYDGSNPTYFCAGSYTKLYSYSTGPTKWNTGETTSNIQVNKIGKYFATTETAKGCKDTSDIIEVKSNKVNTLTIKANTDTTICLNDSVELELIEKYGYTNMFWVPYYSTNQKIKVGGTGSINVYAMDSATGCSIKSNSIQVTVLLPPIESLCMVTADSATGKNKLIWKPTKGKRISFYNIYRESDFAGEFDLIGDVDLANAGEFIDTAKNPKQRAFTYYISAIDSCNNSASESRYYAHTTLHLTANLGVSGENNLNWSDYYGIFPLNTYVIYRSNQGGKFKALGSVAATVHSFSDLTPPSGSNRYYIGIKGGTACDTMTSFAGINSNMVAFGILGAEKLQLSAIKLSPNPSSDFIAIDNLRTGNQEIQITTLQGKLVKSVVLNEQNNRIDISELTAGMYIATGKDFASTKWIKN